MILVWLCVYGIAACSLAKEPAEDRDQAAFFENRIRPILVKYCYECHSADAKELGGKLRLDDRELMQRGGESGRLFVIGAPQESLLIQALRYDGVEMPPEMPLSEAIVRDFETWIQHGAVDPRVAETSSNPIPVGRQTSLWSLQEPIATELPAVRDKSWPRDPLDYFFLSRLESQDLKPCGDAAPETLIKRLYFDLIGLQPTFAEVEQFIEDCRVDAPQAEERLVDRLLASPEFGRRWGRHWMDIARYAESNGNDGLGRNPTFPHAWRYRDYVIASLGQDVPYDQFLVEQLAGDLMDARTPQTRDRQLVATGFLAMAAKPAKAMNNDFDMDVVADQIDMVGRGIMGLSVGCARCHDHKFDPIPTRDYYALAGIFTSTETMWGLAANENLTAPPTDLHVLECAPVVSPPADFVETVFVLESNTGIPKKVSTPPWDPERALAMGVRDRDEPLDCKVNINGDSKQLGESVPRGFLPACEVGGTLTSIAEDESGRLDLAKWLTNPKHPLTARVMANRIWLHLFGEGIVRTPDDFGTYGDRPTHPQLLDYLAIQFVEQGWSVKQLIRRIVLSRTYQLGSEMEADDGLAYHRRRRLDAESLRDRILQVSGELDQRAAVGSIVGHRDILINLAGNLHQPSNLRSVYLCYLRGSPPPELAAFDLPEFSGVLSQRPESTVPGQALHLLNSPFVVEQSMRFAERLLQECENDRQRVCHAFQRCYGREPSRLEMEHAIKFLRDSKAAGNDVKPSWYSFCQALLISSEFRYVD